MLKTFKKNENVHYCNFFYSSINKKIKDLKKVFNPDNKYAWNIDLNIGFIGLNFPV